MYNGDIKTIEDLHVGDELLGDDGTPCVIRELTPLSGNLCRIEIFNTKEALEITGAQILCFKATGNLSVHWDQDRTAFVIEYLDNNNTRKKKQFSTTEGEKKIITQPMRKHWLLSRSTRIM